MYAKIVQLKLECRDACDFGENKRDWVAGAGKSGIKFLVENVFKSQNQSFDSILGSRHDRCLQGKTRGIATE